MRTVRDHRSGDLFDPWEYLGPQRRKLLEQSWAGVFREYLLKHLPVQELAAAFRSDFGRPSKDLHVAIGALILQQLHDLTDQQAVEAVALNIGWQGSRSVSEIVSYLEIIPVDPAAVAASALPPLATDHEIHPAGEKKPSIGRSHAVTRGSVAISQRSSGRLPAT